MLKSFLIGEARLFCPEHQRVTRFVVWQAENIISDEWSFVNIRPSYLVTCNELREMICGIDRMGALDEAVPIAPE